eukprot:TRINITY_DN4581_c0_g1_i1.p1 TRINITY_DN4581_c0_g1~~TRINITY_DN4581_c0_g1_i1.p1  ORF type:complete len:120 (-),score=3.98 TRINITY_DN4581_c0_g1_i1:165-524(-)
MQQIALSKKLLWLTVGSIFTTVFVLSSILWWELSVSNKDLSAESKKLIVAEVEEKLVANASSYGERIAGFINESYRVPFSFAAILGDEKAAKHIKAASTVVQLKSNRLLRKKTPKLFTS